MIIRKCDRCWCRIKDGKRYFTVQVLMQDPSRTADLCNDCAGMWQGASDDFFSSGVELRERNGL